MLTLRYAITDRLQYGGNELDRRRSLVQQAARLAGSARDAGVDFIQLREKDLAPRDLIGLAREIRTVVRSSGSKTRLLINARVDVACAANADGVHLPAGDQQLSPGEVRRVFGWRGEDTGTGPRPMVSISCHNLEEVERAREFGADLVLFGPVFGKTANGKLLVPGIGLSSLRAASSTAGTLPVLALGGVTAENTGSCIQAGAAGIAAIRLFL